MSFRWILRKAPGSVSGSSPEFQSREEAEAWMGSEWQRLLDEGHLAATLAHGSEELYTMKLTAE